MIRANADIAKRTESRVARWWRNVIGQMSTGFAANRKAGQLTVAAAGHYVGRTTPSLVGKPLICDGINLLGRVPTKRWLKRAG